MAFVRKKTKVYPWPVEIKTPSQTKIGEFDTTSFTGKFARLSRKEIDTFDSSTEFEALKKVLVGWEDISEEDGTPIEFNDKNLKEFAEDIDFVAGVLEAFKKFYSNAQSGN
jgi:hypothetical protein|tara:strand:+ start:2031 stop:2363 length:333 start_codon:yes stop_codon:yes gene_type:complete